MHFTLYILVLTLIATCSVVNGSMYLENQAM